MKALFLPLLLTLLPGPLAAHAADCLDAAAVARIDARFHVQLGRLDLCDATSPANRTYQTLLFLDGLKLDGPKAPAPWNQDVLPGRWTDRLARLTPRIVHGDAQSCRGEVLAYVDNDDRQTLFLCDYSFEEDMYDPYELASTLLHESRHQEADGFSHVNCDGDEGNCDPSVRYRGGYAVDAESLVKMSITATNLGPVAKDLAWERAKAVALESFREKFYAPGDPRPRGVSPQPAAHPNP